MYLSRQKKIGSNTIAKRDDKTESKQVNDSEETQYHNTRQSLLQCYENRDSVYESENKDEATGIPNEIKARFENQSNLSFDDVRVHYNSDKPAQLQALAYTQGNQVYIGPGQEKHLGHELGHVVQQKTMKVKSTGEINGIPINYDKYLEQNADYLSNNPSNNHLETNKQSLYMNSDVVQAVWIDIKDSDYYMWDNHVNGRIWYHHKSSDLMYFESQGDDELKEHAGIIYAKSFEKWLRLLNGHVLEEDASIVSQFNVSGYGNSKLYFSNPRSRLGWLGLRPLASSDELDREIETRRKLIEGGVTEYIPSSMFLGSRPENLVAGSKSEAGFKRGVWTSNIPAKLSFKPKNQMCIDKIDKYASNDSTSIENLSTLLKGLGFISNNLVNIYAHIGEMEILVADNGHPYLVDVAPTTESGSSEEQKEEDKECVCKNLNGIINILETKISSRTHSSKQY